MNDGGGGERSERAASRTKIGGPAKSERSEQRVEQKVGVRAERNWRRGYSQLASYFKEQEPDLRRRG